MPNIFQDSFTDSDGTLLNAHTPNVGTSWTRLWYSSGEIEIQGNTAVPNGGLSDGAIYVADTTYSTADYNVKVTAVTVDSSDDSSYLLGRVQDQENMYALKWTTTVLTLYKKVSGTWSTLAARGANAPVDGDVLELRFSGTSIGVYKNNTEIVTVTDSSISAAGKAGIAMGGGAELVKSGDDMSDQQFDDFIVEVTNLDVEVLPSAISGSFTIPSHTVVIPAEVSPSAISQSFTILDPSVTATATVTPDPIAQSFTIVDPTIQAGSVISPDSISSNFSIIDPVIEVSVTVSADVIINSFTIPSPIVEGAVSISPDAIESSFTIPNPSVEGTINVVADSLSNTFTIPSHTINIYANTIVTPDVVSSSFQVLSPSFVYGYVITPDVVGKSFTIPTHTILTNSWSNQTAIDSPWSEDSATNSIWTDSIGADSYWSTNTRSTSWSTSDEGSTDWS